MFVCSCNALTEKDFASLDFDQYLKIKGCGACQLYVKGLLVRSFKKAKEEEKENDKKFRAKTKANNHL